MTNKLFVMSVLLCTPMVFGFFDSFDSATLDTSMWTVNDDTNMSTAQTNGRIEIYAPGNLDLGTGLGNGESAGVSFNETAGVGDWFDVSVDFNAADCTTESLMDIQIGSVGHEGDFFFLGNGNNSSFAAGRNWVFLKFTDGNIVDQRLLGTTDTNGTFAVSYDNNTATFFCNDTEFYSSDLTGWTDPSSLSLGIYADVWDGNSELTGAGSYFDNFSAIPEPTSLLILLFGCAAVIGCRGRV